MPNLDEMTRTLPKQNYPGLIRKRGLRADRRVCLQLLGSEKIADA
jgi:hypothetical protein